MADLAKIIQEDVAVFIGSAAIAVRPALLAFSGRGINPPLVEVFRRQRAHDRGKAPERIQHNLLCLVKQHGLGILEQRGGQIIIAQGFQA